MQLQTAERKNAKIKMCLQGPSGSGKTLSALYIAFGLCNNWPKIAVIDTENHSSELYAHVGGFQVLELSAPFNPEKYIEAIQYCEKAGIEVIIIDSISHEWEGSGGILDIHGNMAGNSFTNWNKVTPRHNAFVQGILQCNAHIIATIRTKQDYVLTEKNGKQVPEKVGLKGIQRDGVEYDFTLVFDLNIKHFVTASKDRTSLFIDTPEFKISVETGEKILKWCKEGTSSEDIRNKIQAASSVDELVAIFKANPSFQEMLLDEFTERRKELQHAPVIRTTINHAQNLTTHGIYRHQ